MLLLLAVFSTVVNTCSGRGEENLTNSTTERPFVPWSVLFPETFNASSQAASAIPALQVPTPPAAPPASPAKQQKGNPLTRDGRKGSHRAGSENPYTQKSADLHHLQKKRAPAHKTKREAKPKHKRGIEEETAKDEEQEPRQKQKLSEEEEDELEEVESLDIEAAEEEEATPVDTNTACMLIGGVSFVMVLFTVVNYEDDDIRRYAWALISTVCSIFVAVMLFTSANSWVMYFFAVYVSPAGLCALQYVHLLFWVCALQLTIALASGTIGEGKTHSLHDEEWVMADALRADFGKPVCNADGVYDETLVRNRKGVKSVMEFHGLEIPVEKKKTNLEDRKRRMKCWGTLIAHMSAFAAINAGGTMQHLEVFASSPIMTFLPLPLTQLFVMTLFASFKYLRDHLHSAAKAAGQAGYRAKLFDEEVIEAENDITALVSSFLFVQSLRYFQTGRLPTMAGELEDTPWYAVRNLFISGIFMEALSIGIIVVKSISKLEKEDLGHRLLTVFGSISGMSFSWCVVFGMRTIFMNTSFLEDNGIGSRTLSGRVLLALIVSLLSTGLIFLLDIISDTAKKGVPPSSEGPQEVVFEMVFAASIICGLSWEHCFDGGAETIASKTSRPLCCRTALALFIFFAIVPAWRNHILRKHMILQEYFVTMLQADIRRHVSTSGLYSQLPEDIEREASRTDTALEDIEVKDAAKDPTKGEAETTDALDTSIPLPTPNNWGPAPVLPGPPSGRPGSARDLIRQPMPQRPNQIASPPQLRGPPIQDTTPMTMGQGKQCGYLTCSQQWRRCENR